MEKIKQHMLMKERYLVNFLDLKCKTLEIDWIWMHIGEFNNILIDFMLEFGVLRWHALQGK